MSFRFTSDEHLLELALRGSTEVDAAELWRLEFVEAGVLGHRFEDLVLLMLLEQKALRGVFMRAAASEAGSADWIVVSWKGWIKVGFAARVVRQHGELFSMEGATGVVLELSNIARAFHQTVENVVAWLFVAIMRVFVGRSSQDAGILFRSSQ